MKKLIYALIALIVVLAIGSTRCIYISTGIKGNGIPEKRTFNVKNFKNIILRGRTQAKIVQGDTYKVEVELDSNLYDFFGASVFGNTLYIGFEKGNSVQSFKVYKIYIQAPVLAHFSQSGSGRTEITGFYNDAADMKITQSGTKNTIINAMIRSLEIELSGSGSIMLSGKANVLTVKQSGLSSVNAFEFQTETCFVDSSGQGDAKVTAKNTLEIKARGLSKVLYKGEPSRIILHSSGSAKVERVK